MWMKSFLAGCVGSVIAVTGAQAAKPVEYVKVCNLYGAGFYYVPGTDMCLKVGGYLRSQTEWNSFNGLSFGSTNGTIGPSTIDNGKFTRATNPYGILGRGVISADARNQTEYGTVRSYIRVGWQTLGTATPTNSLLVDRAFIQFAGFTFGLSQSMFDIFSNTEVYSYTNAKTSGDSYLNGQQLLGYTARFGNGISASIAMELPREHNIAGALDATAAAFGTNGVTTTDTAGQNVPDIVGNLRIDQAWGYVGVSGAIHQVSGQYYNSPSNTNSFHPDDKYGWAAQVGGMVNLPWGDTFGASFIGSKGAVGYATKAGNWQMYGGDSVGLGWVSDGIFDNAAATPNTPIFLTNAVSVNAGYERKWNPRWQTSLYGGYTRIWYDSEAIDIINRHLPGAAGTTPCGVPVAGAVFPPVNFLAGSNNSCSPNFSFWQVGSRTQWNISGSTYMGVDVTYTRLETAYKGDSVGIYSANAPQSAVNSINNQDTWSGVFRVQHQFTP